MFSHCSILGLDKLRLAVPTDICELKYAEILDEYAKDIGDVNIKKTISDLEILIVPRLIPKHFIYFWMRFKEVVSKMETISEIGELRT